MPTSIAGAAKLTSLLKVSGRGICFVGVNAYAYRKGVAPRIMLVEEAGQVLEAHVLGSLVPSVEHLVLIGDPLQLRPNLNNYCAQPLILICFSHL